MFPGLGRMEAELRSWDWTFGKTPKFTVQTPLELREQEGAGPCSALLQMEVRSGRIHGCLLDVPSDWLPQRLSAELCGVLLGERFCPQRAAAAFSTLLRAQSGPLHPRLHHLCDAVLAVIG